MSNSSTGHDMEKLGADDCWDLLRTVTVGHLAVVVDGNPEIFPVNYKVDNGSLVFRTGDGTKLHAATGDAAVALEADGTGGEPLTAWSVEVKGHAVELDPSPDLMRGAGLTLFPWEAGLKDHFVRIIPRSVTGRRFPVASPLTWWNHVGGATRAGLA
ncbi:Nitroimidazol reductase NimA, pyridoxamine 5'-phosphate oxidase superfamily [Pseudarthrobacter enclensis]|uniref:Pyridoxamine 5'-phosphate oxidase n=1 Tax=Pseudarthrobacter enclensis TaxID=993070 RepID=A0A0V8IT42_9MICC|nr:pyridoxamine 5'-phosphate oxidase family protein [Pseudarthrobacter enclensis]KSU77894.1 pyridoxamine 5'-phosphate oxidase [Pseudarthrobacter enclensis]SCB95947.1 Nitroimidazol reductase NimA, pyridoxamine 5'-phosphate oxidase superfamily [Pseudarthrobacter enclensis]